MKEEKDFFKTCFNTVAGLEVKNESQAIAKEVVLSEIENLQQENKQLKEQVQDLKADYGTIAQIERDLDKEVIEEVREFVGSEEMYNCSFEEETNKLLQILDKAKCSDD